VAVEFSDLFEIAQIGMISLLIPLLLFGQRVQLEVRLGDYRLQKRCILLALGDPSLILIVFRLHKTVTDAAGIGRLSPEGWPRCSPSSAWRRHE